MTDGMKARGRATRLLSEMIGRVALRLYNLFPTLKSVDETQADYAFWDALRRGKKDTYRLAGLFVQPILHHIASWTLGDGFSVKCDDARTMEAVNRFARDHLLALLDTFDESMGVGDGYLVVNPDGSLTEVPADQVEIVTDELDYRRVLAYRIHTKLDKATITDEYRLDGRTITIKRAANAEATTLGDGTVVGAGATTLKYENVIGRLPVAHLPNRRSSNEVHGRPEAEALLHLLGEYDDVLTKSVAGVKVMGNPIPTIEEVEDAEAAREELATGEESYRDADGVEQTRPVVDFNDVDMIFTTGKFNLKSPGAFTEDAWRMLKALFYLMLQHANVPEWVWGGHIESSKASVDAQLPAWTRFIVWRRRLLEPWLMHILQTWLAYRSFVEPGLDADAELTIEWPALVPADETALLEKVKFATENGLLPKVDALRALDLVEDPEEAVERAKEEAAEAQEEFEAQADREIARLAAQGEPLEDAA